MCLQNIVTPIAHHLKTTTHLLRIIRPHKERIQTDLIAYICILCIYATYIWHQWHTSSHLAHSRDIIVEHPNTRHTHTQVEKIFFFFLIGHTPQFSPNIYPNSISLSVRRDIVIYVLEVYVLDGVEQKLFNNLLRTKHTYKHNIEKSNNFKS